VSGNTKALIIGLLLGLLLFALSYACDNNMCKGSSDTNCYIYY
jgi:hypothetical protein